MYLKTICPNFKPPPPSPWLHFFSPTNRLPTVDHLYKMYLDRDRNVAHCVVCGYLCWHVTHCLTSVHVYCIHEQVTHRLSYKCTWTRYPLSSTCECTWTCYYSRSSTHICTWTRYPLSSACECTWTCYYSRSSTCTYMYVNTLPTV